MKNIFLIISFLFITTVANAQTFDGVTIDGVTIGGTDNQVLIIAIGDSITNGQGSLPLTEVSGYRSYLYNNLSGSSVKFIGSHFQNGSTDFLTFGRHEGVDGDTSTQIEARIPSILTYNFRPENIQPESSSTFILIHAGTNDITTCTTVTACTAGELQAISDNIIDMIDLIRADNDDIKIIVAKIVPRADTDLRENADTDTTALNVLIQTDVENHTDYGSRVYLADMNTAFKTNLNWATELVDTEGSVIHPSNAGYEVMANTLADIIRANQ